MSDAIETQGTTFHIADAASSTSPTVYVAVGEVEIRRAHV